MAILATNIDSVFDIIRKLRESNFEIASIEYRKSKNFYRVKIIRDDLFVKIFNDSSELLITSNFAPCIFTKTVLICDDLSYERIK